MAIGDEVRADLGILRAAALDPATDIDTRERFIAAMSRGGYSSSIYTGRSSDRDYLVRTYLRRLRRADEIRSKPVGTEKLVEELEREAAPEVLLFTIENDTEIIYVFARVDLKSLLGCVVGQQHPRYAE